MFGALISSIGVNRMVNNALKAAKLPWKPFEIAV